jgi:hypothetical protein
VSQVTSATVRIKRSVLLAKQDSMERRRVAHWRQQRVKSAQQENILPPRDQHFVLFAPRASSLRHQEKKYVKTVRQAGTNRKKTSRAHSVKSVQQDGVPFLIKIKNKY